MDLVRRERAVEVSVFTVRLFDLTFHYTLDRYQSRIIVDHLRVVGEGGVPLFVVGRHVCKLVVNVSQDDSRMKRRAGSLEITLIGQGQVQYTYRRVDAHHRSAFPMLML